MYAVGIVLARCGSKGISYKNIFPIFGRPMISYVLNALNKSKISEYFVSTDCNEIGDISRNFGAKIINRPKKLSQDDTSSFDSLSHAINNLKNKPELILLIQPTSPLIISDDINNTIDLLCKYDSVITVVEDHSFLWNYDNSNLYPKFHNPNNRQPRQLLNKTFKETGSIYGIKYDSFIKYKQIICGTTGFVEVPKYRSFEIDDMNDVFIVESILKNSS